MIAGMRTRVRRVNTLSPSNEVQRKPRALANRATATPSLQPPSDGGCAGQLGRPVSRYGVLS